MPRGVIARLTMDTSAVTWRGRAMRYVLIYLMLALVLVGLRYATQDVRVNLRATTDREAELLTVRDGLEVQVQALTTPQRVREWAFAQSMRRFAEAEPKVTADIPLVPLPAGLPPSPPDASPPSSTPAPVSQTRLEVRTQWK
ncbi:hypothetical protein [Deinococcus puniceus]|uniref:Cell division protein FtsL n=1 Tax=Deinococcus puniceus TaxID=1182568 RepID=A0A172TD18_9DEIO|nr:hypothetical protein [Deinococcus puniceus]ANE44891.1 hypothetical protein SU48_08890 [Deinococcus puniceus]